MIEVLVWVLLAAVPHMPNAVDVTAFHDLQGCERLQTQLEAITNNQARYLCAPFIEEGEEQ